ncbi:Lcl C-terminal domain-containing protein [Bacterioplanoides pacificum]|uniref:DUF1566 domain-containing protein n=1 Tax=Bacterioplanoides pacificum TaxID=1171596 RepID=A0ABV7VPP7_9GAMM
MMKIKSAALFLSVLILQGCPLQSDNQTDNFDPSGLVAQPRQLSLSARANTSSVTLNWTAPVAAQQFTLYRARESITALNDLNNIAALADGQAMAVTGNQHQLDGLENGRYYYFLLTARTADQQILRSPQVEVLIRNQSIAFQSAVNDSGRLTPDSAVSYCHPQHQDCGAGRDATHNDNSDGYAGFSFTRLNHLGEEVADAAQPWSCVRDNVTGLVWEVKTDHVQPQQRQLTDKRWIYSYYDQQFVDADGSDGPLNGPLGGSDGIFAGYADRGINSGGDHCGNSQKICTSQQYVQDINALKLCGFSDWRLPRFVELYSLKILQQQAAEIDTDYFPHTQQRYLTSDFSLAPKGNGQSDSHGQDVIVAGSHGLLTVSFNGAEQSWKSRHYGSLRLVRGGQ